MTAAASGFPRAASLDASTAAALLAWGLALADTKHRLGLRTSEWVNGGPALEAAVGASALTQDELGHARSLYAMLRDFPGAPEGIGAENDLESRQLYFNPRLLNQPWPSWLDVIAANVLIDRATTIAVAAGQDSAFIPLKGRIGKIIQEERFHRIFGDAWLAKLCRMGDDMRGKMQAAVDHFWGTAVSWFGPDNDPAVTLLLQAGILHAAPDQMRRQWLNEVTPLLEKNDLAVPNTRLDWSGWRPATREAA